MLINDQQATPFVKNVIDVLPSVAREAMEDGQSDSSGHTDALSST
jgi:hypothetical protein